MYPFATYNLFFMDKRLEYRHLLHTIQRVDRKCDKILGILSIMRDESKDALLESIKDSARDMYQSSLDERKRVGKLVFLRHD